MSFPTSAPTLVPDPARAGAGRNRWSIVLAGGSGTRLLDYVEARFGEPRPKQYCAFTGDRSMFQHTVDRAIRLTSAVHTVPVIAAGHERWALPQLADHGIRPLIQPVSRDTAPGIFLPMAWIRAHDPGATVHVFPSDHFIAPADRFLTSLSVAGDVAEAASGALVLMGVVPDAVETEYGYVEPDRRVAPGIARVRSFVEKPDRAAAAAAVARGALWNTFIMTGTVEAFWELGRRTLPRLVERFDRLVDAIRAGRGDEAIAEAYVDMPAASFSRDVLAHVAERLLLIPLVGVDWSDWGRAERVDRTVAGLGARPARAANAAAAGAG